MAKVKNIVSGEVHSLENSTTTDCGKSITVNPQNWEPTNGPVTCDTCK